YYFVRLSELWVLASIKRKARCFRIYRETLSRFSCAASMGSLFSTPEEVARQAADNDVHVIGVSSLAAGHLTLVPALRDALAQVGRPDIMIVVGGVIPPGDFDELYAAGATAIFPPGTVIADAAIDLLHRLAERLGYTLD
ncbi:cobalamin-dependent protein, partial [Mycobacterium tuberculosis]